jgi:hypothetical protein
MSESKKLFWQRRIQNQHKKIGFVYTNNEKKHQENNPIHNSSRKKIKYIGINITKKLKELYNENYKTLK